jgi:hypothetical protein
MRVIIRPATPEDIPYLEKRIREQSYFEHVDVRKMIVFIAEYGGEIVGFSAARLMWQIEPIMLMPEFRKLAPHFARQKATLGLIRAIEGWLADRGRNTTGIYSYFCSIKGRTMRALAEAYGMLRVYTGCAFYGRDL